ncbi:MAG: glycosyltransferase [Thermodesulfobacteriota bacterium]
MRFSHFLITRFNVNIEPTDFLPRLGDAWLSLRFDLFQKFCFPSVHGQRCQQFTWLVLFDRQTPKRFAGLIKSYERYANFVPVLCGEYESIIPQVVETMRRMSPDTEWLLTTRLDNDDALARNFTQTVQEAARHLLDQNQLPGNRCYMNLPNGLQYHDGTLYAFKDVTNAFVSLLEPAASPKTVFWVDHPAIHTKAPVVQIQAPPLWLQTVHGTNVYNYLRGSPLDDDTVLRGFDLNL